MTELLALNAAVDKINQDIEQLNKKKQDLCDNFVNLKIKELDLSTLSNNEQDKQLMDAAKQMVEKFSQESIEVEKQLDLEKKLLEERRDLLLTKMKQLQQPDVLDYKSGAMVMSVLMIVSLALHFVKN